MNHLLRELAPLSESTWEMIDEEAKSRLTPALAARRLVDFRGPLGWTYSATNLGRVESLASAPADGVSALRRRVLPLVELRADFTLSQSELRDAARGADDVDLSALDEAAHQIATAENTAIFHGIPKAISGLSEVSPHGERSLAAEVEQWPLAIAGAVECLLQAGIAGPYGLALGSEQYRAVLGSVEHGGYPLEEHLRRVVQGSLVWAPGLNGAQVISMRGGDFVLECGQDLAVGYVSHDDERVRLYLQESFSFHAATPEASVTLTPAQASR